MKMIFSILLTLSALSGCVKKDVASVPAEVKLADTTKTVFKVNGGDTYLALGDSYTIGESVSLSQSFPYQLSALLGLQANPTIIATTGWTTSNLIYAISNSNITNKTYDFVTLLIGVNDQYQGMNVDDYRTRFKQLLQTAITFAKGDRTRVFVLSIPDYGVTPFANRDDSRIGPEIDNFNFVNRSESSYAGVNYLDITGISKEAATDATLIAADGLHPSAKMYALWVQQLAPMVAARLNK
jgi:lysophospholipase L1-like esterase